MAGGRRTGVLQVSAFFSQRLVVFKCTTDRIFKKRGYERDEFLFRTVIKISKIQFTQFLHTSSSKFFLRALPRYYMLQPMLNILFYIALLSSKILVLFGLDFRAGNSKFQRPKIPARSVVKSYNTSKKMIHKTYLGSFSSLLLLLVLPVVDAMEILLDSWPSFSSSDASSSSSSSIDSPP